MLHNFTNSVFFIPLHTETCVGYYFDNYYKHKQYKQLNRRDWAYNNGRLKYVFGSHVLTIHIAHGYKLHLGTNSTTAVAVEMDIVNSLIASAKLCSGCVYGQVV